MKITFLLVGKTSESYLIAGMTEYAKRMTRYIPFEIKEMPAVKQAASLNKTDLIKREGELILDTLKPSDVLILLDDKGKEYTSQSFSLMITDYMNKSTRSLVFAVGGAYGFSAEVYKKAESKLSLSRLTFSHQLVRLIFMEQIYRAFTIIKGEPYHHE